MVDHRDPREIAYWVICLLAFALLIWDLFDRGPKWTTIVVFGLVAVGMFLRPGGVFKRR